MTMEPHALFHLIDCLEDAALTGANRCDDAPVSLAAKAADATPALAGVCRAVRAFLAAEPAQRPAALLRALSEAYAAERSLARAGAEGPLTPLSPGSGHWIHEAPYSRLQPLIAALSGSGSGRLTILEDALNSRGGDFADFRVAPYVVAALGDPDEELEELLGRILTSWGEEAAAHLKAGFNPAGKREMERRVYWMTLLRGAAENDWYRSVLPDSRREVRETLIGALGLCPDNTALLLELYRSESGKCRDLALRSLARMSDPESRAFWTEELQRRPDCPPCLEGLDSPLAADMAAKALDSAFSEALERGKTKLDRSELLTLTHAAFAAYGKWSGEMRDTLLRWAERHEALDALLPGEDTGQLDISAADMLEKILLVTVLWNPCAEVLTFAQQLGERYPARFLSAYVLAMLLTRPQEAFDRFGSMIVKPGLLRRENAQERAVRIQIMRALAAVRSEGGWHIPYARKEALNGARKPMRYPLAQLDPRWAETLSAPRVKRDGGVFDLEDPWNMSKRVFRMEWLTPPDPPADKA